MNSFDKIRPIYYFALNFQSNNSDWVKFSGITEEDFDIVFNGPALVELLVKLSSKSYYYLLSSDNNL